MTSTTTYPSNPIYDDVADLLSLIANDEMTPRPQIEWDEFTRALAYAADDDGLINPNVLRPLLRGVVAPKRIGAFTHRAKCAGLIENHGWVVSNDAAGRNGGRPARVYRWLGDIP